jgi:hypothetical protein
MIGLYFHPMRAIFLTSRAHWLLLIEAHWSFCQ